jgi:uncharacterized damage-inducible protein DinB
MDITTLRTILWQQFGAAIDMLENAMLACPDELWGDRSQEPEFWHLAYHTLFFLDFYLSDSIEEFTPPAPFTLSELDPAGVLPERVYTKEELQTYLEHCRSKCKAAIEALTEENANQRFKYGRIDISRAELFLYKTRHVQHHTAQLNLILRQRIDSAPRWVIKAKSELGSE